MKLLFKLGLFVFFILTPNFLSATNEVYLKKLPPHLVLGQELKWEGFQLKIYTSQKSVSLVFPLDIYIVAYNPDLDLSFTGNMSLAIESLAARTYRETTITEKDLIAPGIYKITYPFEQTGEYKIKVNLVALNGAFTQIESTIQVRPSESLMQYQKNSFMTMVIVGFVFVVIYFVRKKFFKK